MFLRMWISSFLMCQKLVLGPVALCFANSWVLSKSNQNTLQFSSCLMVSKSEDRVNTLNILNFELEHLKVNNKTWSIWSKTTTPVVSHAFLSFDFAALEVLRDQAW